MEEILVKGMILQRVTEAFYSLHEQVPFRYLKWRLMYPNEIIRFNWLNKGRPLHHLFYISTLLFWFNIYCFIMPRKKSWKVEWTLISLPNMVMEGESLKFFGFIWQLLKALVHIQNIETKLSTETEESTELFSTSFNRIMKHGKTRNNHRW